MLTFAFVSRVIRTCHLQTLSFAKCLKLVGPCSLHLQLSQQLSTSIQKFSEDNLKKDSELQELIKEMYRDFNTSKDEIFKYKETKDETKDLKKNLYEITHENEAFTSEYNPDIIYDYDEERTLKKKGLWQDVAKRKKIISVKEYTRGKRGVFDLEEVVDLLREQNAKNVVAISIPVECQFVEHLVIATGKSARHIYVVSEYLNKVHKLKKHKTDSFIIVEGKGSDWVAIDMQNIAVHILTEEVREEKDMELLWTVGREYDDKSLELSEELQLSSENISHLLENNDLHIKSNT